MWLRRRHHAFAVALSRTTCDICSDSDTGYLYFTSSSAFSLHIWTEAGYLFALTPRQPCNLPRGHVDWTGLSMWTGLDCPITTIVQTHTQTQHTLPSFMEHFYGTTTNKVLSGLEARELSALTHGPTRWWVELQKKAAV